MKKILFTILFTFIFILQVNAADKFYLGEKVPNMYIESKNGNDLHNGAPFLLTRADGKLVYCIDPFKMMNTTNYYNSYFHNTSLFKLSNEALNKMNIIAYYGYGYSNHTDLKWYGITQFLIYKALGIESVYFTDVYYGNKVDKYIDEVKELEYLVNNYYKLPSFSSKIYEYEPNKTYEIVDENNVLNNYEIVSSNINSTINNNKLVINTLKSGSYTISFVRKSPVNTNYTLYYLEGAQSLLYPGKINDITFDLNITVNSGGITINKYDSESQNRLEADIKGATFGIYKDNKLINKLVINNNGTASIDELPLGDYIVKELTPSKGYNIDDKEYNITLNKENNKIVINSYSKVIKGTLKINKYYGSDDEYKLDKDAVFEIYNNNKLIKTVSGQVVETLEYGTYYIKQINGKKYYDLISDFNVSILEEKDYVYNFYTEKTDEIKAYEEILNKREESLNKKEEELKELENKLNKEKEELQVLKENIINEQMKIDTEKQNIEKLKNEITNREEELKQLENKTIQEKNEIEKIKNELIILKNNLITKTEEILNLEKNLNQKKQDLNKKEENIEKLKEQYNNVLIVEVPDTYKKSNIKYISKKLILIGIIFIINATLNKRKKYD